MRKLYEILLMTSMSVALFVLGIWLSRENAMWLGLTLLGILGALELNKMFNNLNFDEFEVDEDEEE